MSEITRTPIILPGPKMGRPSKYRNKRTLGGYASIKEGKRAAELKLLEKAGQIRNLREQVPFVLIPSQTVAEGHCIERPCRYVADFCYDEQVKNVAGFFGWQEVVEDCKGMRTDEYVIKRKLLLYVHKIRIRET